METGKEYEVFYRDDSQVRKKNLIFNKEEHGLLHFFNDRNNCEEILPIKIIVRIQGKWEKDQKQLV